MRGKAIQGRIAARDIAARTQSSSSNTDEDWTSLSATFDRAANKPGAFQGIANRLDEIPGMKPPAARRIVDVAADKAQWKEFLAGTDLQSAAPASAAVCERNSSPKHIRENSPGKGARSPSPTEDPDPNQDQNMRAKESSSAEAEDLSKSDGESDSSSDEVDENLFLENLEKLAASGDLDTVEGVNKQAFVNAVGAEMLVSGDFVFNLTHKLFQRTDPFNRLVKNYEDKKDEMVRAQRNFVKDEMAYLHRKMREQLKKDSAELAKVMQETYDKREVELRQLRTENQKAAIDQALLVSDFHQLFKRKNAAPSGAEELAQCQRDLRDAQIRSLLKDGEIQALELHIHMLKGLMHAHDIALPPETSESAPASAPPAENMPTWGSSNAPPIVDLHNNGWGTSAAPSPAPTQESYHGFSDESMEPPNTYGKYGKNSYHKGFKGKVHKGSSLAKESFLLPV